MYKIAAIDIGTNSMRLLLCEVQNGQFIKKTKDVINTRIGKGIGSSSLMSDEAMDKNIKALMYFKERAENYGAKEIITIATSAVRDAANKSLFINKVLKETGLQLKVLDGDEEAYAGMLGVAYGLSDKEDILILDIGGGSTEIVLCKNKIIKYATSINAGAVRMTEKFIKENPISDEDINDLKNELEKVFSNPLSDLTKMHIDKIIVIGGTATTIAAIFHQMEVYDERIIHNTILSIDYIKNLYSELKAMSMDERYGVKGLEKERADIITTGIYIMLYLTEKLSKSEIFVSDSDNLEGAIIGYSSFFGLF